MDGAASGACLAVALGAFGILASDFVGKGILGLAKSPISPVMVGIVVGMALRNLVPLPDRTGAGLRFAGTKVLRLGIILLGIRLSVFDVARLGALSLPVVVVCILAGVLFTSFLARVFSLPPRLGLLIGVGTAICGVSAIAATGPVIEAPRSACGAPGRGVTCATWSRPPRDGAWWWRCRRSGSARISARCGHSA